MIKVQGVRGELINNELYYLDENNVGRKETIVTDINKVMTGNGNPNLAQVNEIKKIAFGDKILYEPRLDQSSTYKAIQELQMFMEYFPTSSRRQDVTMQKEDFAALWKTIHLKVTDTYEAPPAKSLTHTAT